MRQAAAQAADAIRESILAGRIPAGARIAELDLARQLSVSRTPIREALSRLAAEGLVELSPNRGARVASWTSGELREIFEVRLRLEPYAVSQALPLLSPAELDELGHLAQSMLALGRDQAMADQHPVNGRAGRQRAHPGLAQLKQQPPRAPPRMRPTPLADQRLNPGVQLPRLIAGPVGMVSQPGQPVAFIAAQPAVHRLTGHPIAAGHLGDRRTGYDLHDGVIALLHDAQLHEHGPATPYRERRHGEACPSGRCQASGEANVSTISRSRTVYYPARV